MPRPRKWKPLLLKLGVFLILVLALGLSGCSQPSSVASSKHVAAEHEVPSIVKGSSMNCVRTVLAEWPQQADAANAQSHPLPALHYFTRPVGTQCQMILRGTLYPGVVFYFVFLDDALEKIVESPPTSWRVTGESNGAPVLSAVTDVDLYTVVADAEPVSFDSFAVNANEQIKKARSAHESCVEPNPVLATLSVAEPQATEKRYAESKALLSELDGCKVRLGMDEAEVIALLGQPTAIQRQSEWQVLTFGRASNTGTFPSPIVHVTLTPDGVRAVDSQYVPGH